MNKTILIVFLTVAILNFTFVFIWFREGYILGTAEAVIPFYNLERYYQQVKDAWADNNPGLGLPNGIITAYAPTYFIFSLLEKSGLPGFIIEASFFWFLLTSVGVGVIFLVRELFPKIHWRFILIAILFYYFNPISLVNVWNRFLFNYIVFWAMLPIVTFLFIRGLNSRNYVFAFLIGVISAIYSLSLSVLAFDILLWLVFLYITIFRIVTQKGRGEKLFFIKFFFLSLVYFCLVNFWWISQIMTYLYSGKYATDLSLFFDQDLTTLTVLSKLLGNLVNVFVFKHGTFFSTPIVEWAKIFDINDIVFIEFLISGIILFYIMKNIKRVNTLLLGTLFFLGIFLTKGSAPPLGEIFQFFFERVNVLHSFRNAFEKFGFIIILAAAPLLAASLEYLSQTFKRYGKIIYAFCFLIILALYGYPFFSGLVFTSAAPPTNDYSIGYKVKVPEYYEQADGWLRLQGKNFRFIGFPFWDQGVTYKWERGYQGIEPSSVLFSTPNILLNTTVPYYDKVVENLEKLFLYAEDFSKVANALNAKYIMVRSDIDFHERGMRDPATIETKLLERERDGEFKRVAEFGKLAFWENMAWEDKIIYPASSLVQVSPQPLIADFTLNEYKKDLVFHIGDLDSSLIRIIYPEEDKSISDFKSKTYTFNINNEGFFEVILDTYYLKNYIEDSSATSEIIIDKNIVLKKEALRDDDRLSFGKINLGSGKHEINILSQLTGNLVNIPEQLEIRFIRGENIPTFEFMNFNSYTRYFISFDYLPIGGSQCQVVINQDNDQIRNGTTVPLYARGLSNNINFGSFQDYLETRKTATKAALSFICANGGIIVKNVSVRALLEPRPILIKEESNNISQKPQITYTKDDLTKYKIEVKGAQQPFVLVFSELFDNGWKLNFDDRTFVNKHFLVNAYANGWLVGRLGDFNLTLEFVPQNLLNKGKIISKISFLGGVILIIGLYSFKRFRSA